MALSRTKYLVIVFIICLLGAPIRQVVSATPGGRLSQQLVAAAQKFGNIEKKTLSISKWQSRVEKIEQAYRDAFGGLDLDKATIDRLSTDAVRSLFNASYIRVFYSLKRAQIAPVTSFYAALQEREALTPKDTRRMYRTYISLRDFAHARELLQNNPGLGLPALPDIKGKVDDEANEPAVLVVAADGTALTYKPIQVRQGKRVVIVSHPLCHFTRRATRVLASHPDLWQVLTEHAIWIAPQDGRLTMDALVDWNRHIPAARIYLTYRQSDWPMVDKWGTPSFYFLDAGKLVYEFTGWPQGQSALDKLRKGLRELGLLTATTK